MKSLRNQLPDVLLLLLYPAFLLPSVPVAVDLKVYVALGSLFVIPGYVLVNLIARERLSNLDFPERMAIYLGGSLSLMLIPWVLVYFAGLSIAVAFWGVCALDVLGLISLALVKGISKDRASVSRAVAVSWDSLIVVLFVIACIAGAYVYGANLRGDAISYRTWTRNIYHGEISPTENIPAKWRSEYPGFTYRHSLLFLSYAAIAKAIAADPDVIWVRVPAFFTFFFLAVNYGLSKFIFKKRRIAYLAVVLSPIVLGRSLILPYLVGPSGVSGYVLLPLAILLALWYILNDDSAPLFLLFSVLVAFLLAVEHTQEFVYFLMVLGSCGSVRLLLKRRLTTDVRKVAQTVLISAILCLPYLFKMLSLAAQSRVDVATGTATTFSEGGYLLGSSPDFFIVDPQRLMGGHAGLLTLWTLIAIFLYRKRFYRTPGGSFLLSNFVPVVFIGLNPILAPLVSNLTHVLVVARLGSLIPVLPIASFCIYRAWVTLARACRSGRVDWGKFLSKGRNLSAFILVVLAVPAFASQISLLGFNTIEDKVRQVFFEPKGASPNWLDNKLRAAVETRLVDNPYYLLVEPPRFALFLDRAILEFIKSEIEDNSVFLSEHVVEEMLPAYTNQLAFLGRGVAPGLRYDPLDDKATWPVVRERRAAAYAILSPETSVSEVEASLERFRDEIDYVLVSPKIEFLRSKLDQVHFAGKVYDQKGLSLYEIR